MAALRLGCSIVAHADGSGCGRLWARGGTQAAPAPCARARGALRPQHATRAPATLLWRQRQQRPGLRVRAAEPSTKREQGAAPPPAGPTPGATGVLKTVTSDLGTRQGGTSTRAKVNALFTVLAAAAFAGVIGYVEGIPKASEFTAGYLLELSLSVDNLFVFVLIFDYFQVPTESQSKVLSYGIGGAVFFRALLIGAGLSAVSAFESVNLLFAAVLIFSSIKLLAEGDDEEEDLSNNVAVSFCRRLIPVSDFYDGTNFFTDDNGIRKATPLLLALAVIEITDIFFAFDSIPAIFGVTTDPFIVFTSNIFAILGLRSLFTVIATSMADLRFLQPAIAAVLGFIGAKLLADFFGYDIPTEASLVVVASLLSGGVFLSLRFPKEETNDSL